MANGPSRPPKCSLLRASLWGVWEFSRRASAMALVSSAFAARARVFLALSHPSFPILSSRFEFRIRGRFKLPSHP